jgi:pyruvate dehydrogenase E2 component (dihydrolipoamide acetyltransferase)
MAEIVNMPKLGFDMAEGTLVRWVVSEGEKVSKGAVLAEIETDKATVEVESNYDGVVLRHLITEGTPVPVGDPIAVIGEPGEEVDVQSLTGQAAPVAPPQEVEETPEARPTAAPVEVSAEGAEFPEGVRASPLARKMAEEEGINLRGIDGSGPKGRIVKKDVEAYLTQVKMGAVPEVTERPKVAPEKPEEKKRPAVPMPAFAPSEPPPPDQRIKLERLRKTIGRRMLESKQQVPHFYVTHNYNVASLLELRKQVNTLIPEDERISVNDFVIKAVALALREYPNLNAALDGDEVIHFGRVNIGVAVAIPGGLLTVVCKDADRKPLRQISAEVRGMVSRARDGKVKPDDIEGSTFSLSNMGMYDVEHFAAILNPPEAAILAVGSAMEVPVVENGEIKPGVRMKATISIDHRVSDGAEGARFLQSLAAYLEEPLRLFL